MASLPSNTRVSKEPSLLSISWGAKETWQHPASVCEASWALALSLQLIPSAVVWFHATSTSLKHSEFTQQIYIYTFEIHEG